MKHFGLEFLKRHSIMIGIMTGIGVLVILGLKWLAAILFSAPAGDASVKPLILLSTLMFIIALAGAGYLIMRFYLRIILPLNGLKKTSLNLVERDFPALARSLSNLTLGNLTQKMHLHSQYPPSNVPQSLQTLAETLHILRDNLSAIVDDFNSITAAPCKRFAFIGIDPIAEGRKSAQLLAEMLEGKGEVLVATGFLFNTMLELRRKSFQSWLKMNTEIQIVETFESMMNREFSMNFLDDIFKNHPKLKGIYATDAFTVSIIAEALNSSAKTRKIKLVGHDITHDNVRYLKEGLIDALIDQNPYVQGYDSVVSMFNHLVEGWIPPKPQMYIPVDVITVDNIEKHWHMSQKWILSRDRMARLAKPAITPPARSFRIVFLAREDSDIWERVKMGAFAAKDILASQNIQLDWIVPDETRERADFSALVYSKQIEHLIEEGKTDAIITFVEDARLIASINHAVTAGIPVITVNTEPLNLRSLIQTLDEQATRLSRLSMDLVGTTQHVIIATTEIRNAITSIADGSMIQNTQVEKTRTTMDSLLNSIDQISRQANESEKAAENTTEAVASGASAVEKTLITLKSIAKSVNSTWDTVEELRKHSNRIDDVVSILNTIASKVNVLALNASIEATQAGAHENRFRSVATEIRKLAMNTTEANREVASLIETIKMDIQEVERSMRTCNDLIKNSGKLTAETDSALDNIRMLVDSDRERVQQASTAIQEMQNMSHQVGLSMDQVAMVSSKNTIGVNQVNGSIKEMSVRLEGVRKMAKQLEQMAESESEFLAMFETESNDG